MVIIFELSENLATLRIKIETPYGKKLCLWKICFVFE